MTNPLVLKPAALVDYQAWLNGIKQRIHATRMKIALAANGELITLYYEIGAQIVDREAHAQWGSGFIDAFSHDLRQAFPEVGGFSPTNLRYCRAFFRFYCDPVIWQQAVAKLGESPWAGADGQLAGLLMAIPWGHNIQIFTKCRNVAEARFYIDQTLEQGWSRDVLAMQFAAGRRFGMSAQSVSVGMNGAGIRDIRDRLPPEWTNDTVPDVASFTRYDESRYGWLVGSGRKWDQQLSLLVG